MTIPLETIIGSFLPAAIAFIGVSIYFGNLLRKIENAKEKLDREQNNRLSRLEGKMEFIEKLLIGELDLSSIRKSE